MTIADFTPMPYEVDFTGFLSNTVAPRWFEVLRVKMMNENFSNFNISDSQHLSVIIKSDINYHQLIKYGNLLQGSAWLSTALNSSWEVRFSFADKLSKIEMLSGLQIGVFINSKTHRPSRIPDEIHKKLFITA